MDGSEKARDPRAAGPEGAATTRSAYCSACDRQVRIAVTPSPLHGGQATLPDTPDLVCLDFGERCTGELCPMFGLPRILMGVRLARSGMKDQGWRTVRAQCDGCGAIGELEVLDGGHGYCTVCGATSRVTILELDDGTSVSVTAPTP